jgi:hypothetical protein
MLAAKAAKKREILHNTMKTSMKNAVKFPCIERKTNKILLFTRCQYAWCATVLS